MVRTLVALGLVVLPLAASAAPTPAPAAPSVAPAFVESKPRDGGLIDGRVTAVDYQRNVMSVDSVGRGRMDVNVMPSTSIQGKSAGYRSITDVKNGQHVQIFSSLTGGKYVAQIIRIL